MKIRYQPVVPYDPQTIGRIKEEQHGLHPDDIYLKPGRIPHIWCPGCGLGVVLNTYINGLKMAGLQVDQAAVVSGIGCTGRVAGYLDMDTYHTTHGRAIPFATGLALVRPDLTVAVFSGDGDLFAIGGNHFIHAARRNMDLTVICVNNLNYGMTGGQAAATTPSMAKTTTTPRGNHESPFSLPLLAFASGATYVARWTMLHTRDLTKSVEEALQRRGFSFIEVLAPCPTGYGRRNKEKPLDSLKLYQYRIL
jgi:2-oxoglutarate ferredoxin oxidoreductase subunit beta